MRDDRLEIVKDFFWPGTDSKVGTASVLLALSSNLRGEESIKELLIREGLKCVVTEVGGKSYGEFQDKITKSVIGACLNNGIIEKSSSSIHAVLHAAEEAKKGILVNVSSSVSLAVKIAVVKDSHWIAVAMYGLSAIHPITNHHRIGLGIMHL